MLVNAGFSVFFLALYPYRQITAEYRKSFQPCCAPRLNLSSYVTFDGFYFLSRQVYYVRWTQGHMKLFCSPKSLRYIRVKYFVSECPEQVEVSMQWYSLYRKRKNKDILPLCGIHLYSKAVPGMPLYWVKTDVPCGNLHLQIVFYNGVAVTIPAKFLIIRKICRMKNAFIWFVDFFFLNCFAFKLNIHY